jgi:acetyltransferase-like isoleucine patch superfamily enzyme
MTHNPNYRDIIEYNLGRHEGQYCGSIRSRFARIGENVQIDPTCVFYGTEHISIGNNVRIDAFTIITAGVFGVDINDHVHIASGVRIIASADRVCLCRGSFVGHGSTLLCGSDNLIGEKAIGPTFPHSYRDVKSAPIHFHPHSGVLTHCVVCPGVTLGFGAGVGACSFVNKNIPDGEVWFGTPAKFRHKRSLDWLRSLEGVLNHVEIQEP